MGLTVNRQMALKLTVNRQKRNIFTVNRQMSEPKLAIKKGGGVCNPCPINIWPKYPISC